MKNTEEQMQKLIDSAYLYSESNQVFSELFCWKKICTLNNKEYYKFRLADSFRLCGFLSESEKVYQTIKVNNLPKSALPLYYSYLGKLYEDTNRIDEALNCYTKALNLNNKYTIYYVYTAIILKQKEKDLEAIKLLKKALKKEGDIDEVNYNLSTSYVRIGKYKEALNCINLCLEIDKNYPNADIIKADIEEILRIKGSH